MSREYISEWIHDDLLARPALIYAPDDALCERESYDYSFFFVIHIATLQMTDYKLPVLPLEENNNYIDRAFRIING